MISRRSILGGLGALIAAPAIVKAGSLMKVKAERRLLTPPVRLIYPDMHPSMFAGRVFNSGDTARINWSYRIEDGGIVARVVDWTCIKTGTCETAEFALKASLETKPETLSRYGADTLLALNGASKP